MISFYARDAFLVAVGPVVMAALAVIYLLPLVGVSCFADRVRAFFRSRSL